MDQPAETSSAKHREHSYGYRPPLWRRWWIASLLALLSGAVLWTAGFLGYYLTGEHYAEKYTLALPLRLSLGEGRQTQDTLQIHQVSARGIAVAAGPSMQLPAKDYPILEWQIKETTPGAEVFFTWITSAAPQQTQSLPISDLKAEKGRLALHSSPHWHETVLAAGLIVRGRLPEPLIIEHLSFINPDTPSITALLHQLWSEWTAFEGWRGHSINFIMGGADHQRLLSPVTAVAIWIGLSALLYTGLILMRWQCWNIKPFALFFFVGWLALDARWQLDLWRQLAVTHETFAGKTGEEKRLAAGDRELLQFARSIKDRLSEKSSRIFIITPALGGDFSYRRPRLHYFLLPYNASAQWTKPPTSAQTRPGDYLLFLYPARDVEYHPQKQILRWENDNTLTVKPIFNSQLGALFQVR